MPTNDATKTTDFLPAFLTPAESAPIFEKAARQSVIQQLVRQVPLGITATQIPVVTGRPTAGWVGEGQRKPSSQGSLALKTITPKKLAAILVMSSEVVRANPGNYVGVMRDSLAEKFALAFDRAAIHNEGPQGEEDEGPFDTYLDQASKTVTFGTASADTGGTYGDFVEAIRTIVEDTDDAGRRYRATGWALDDVAEPLLLSAVDTNGRPLWGDPTYTETAGPLRLGRLLGRPTMVGEGVANHDGSIIGYGGDFSQAAWGVLGGISFDVSTQATVTLNGQPTSLWENNLVAIRAEAEFGFILNDPDAFLRFESESGPAGP
jgi:HK97 family phage major capsid protein